MQNTIVICLLLCMHTACSQQQPFKWPDGKKAAVVLTYDDAIPSQLNIAIPQLDKVHLKGTFFLDGRMTEEQILLWRKAGANGHELANHSLYHPCLANSFKMKPQYALENYDTATIVTEIGMMNKILFGINGKKTRTFAYPCTTSTAGGYDYTNALISSGLVKYARWGGDKNSVITNFKTLDIFKVPSFVALPTMTDADLIDFVKSAVAKKGLAVFMFHGVGGDYIQTTAANHEKLLQYLFAHKDEVWVATFQEVMDYIAAHDKE